jgi:hypothetical protein
MPSTMLTRVMDERELRSADPDMGLRGVAALRHLADELEVIHVTHARRMGWSWSQIGSRLEVSKQALHKKYRVAGEGT